MAPGSRLSKTAIANCGAIVDVNRAMRNCLPAYSRRENLGAAVTAGGAMKYVARMSTSVPCRARVRPDIVHPCLMYSGGRGERLPCLFVCES
jgi:hypothetical protein